MTIEQQIGELAEKYFRLHGACSSEADYLIDMIHSALSTVAEEEEKDLT
ncbi:hypothetical protein N6H05_18865 [Sphingobium sp. WTD-1]|nr:hypothetical protein [Sphingobium sp. WTD-1]WIA55079.1 hypothetical protein N6H05_18865 [Sphingobium sp. WTD-1]